MTRAFLLDVAERTVATYVVAFLGLIITADVTDVSALKAAAIAAVPAALTVLKAAAARFVGDPESAALLPAPTDSAAECGD